MKPLNPTSFALITGASSGLGKAIAIEMAKRGYGVLIVALESAELWDTVKHISNAYHVAAFGFAVDLTEADGPEKVKNWCEIEGFSISCLVNNAGFGGTIKFEDAPTEYIDNMLLLNVRATALMTRLILPFLLLHKCSHVLNVASVAAFTPMPYKSVYPASKSFVSFFSHSLHAELKHQGVKVSVVYPGPMLTNSDIVDRLSNWGWFGRNIVLTPQEVAIMAIGRLMRGKRSTLPGFLNKLTVLFSTFMPLSIRLWLSESLLRNEFRGPKAGSQQKLIEKSKEVMHRK